MILHRECYSFKSRCLKLKQENASENTRDWKTEAVLDSFLCFEMQQQGIG